MARRLVRDLQALGVRVWRVAHPCGFCKGGLFLYFLLLYQHGFVLTRFERGCPRFGF
jgi:hypothetical protein